MTNRKNAGLLLIALLSIGSAARGQTFGNRLSQKVAAYDSEKTTTLAQLVEVAQRFQIPMGIEWIDRADEHLAKPIHLRNVESKAVLAAVIKQQDDVRFLVVDGVVQVSAISIGGDPRNFLNIRFPSYAAEKDSLTEASYWLGIWIKRALHPDWNMGGGFGGVSIEEGFNRKVVTFSLRDPTVRQILNRIAAAQGNALWVVHINPSVLMDGEPFFAQAVSSSTGKGNSDFLWDFISLTREPSLKP